MVLSDDYAGLNLQTKYSSYKTLCRFKKKGLRVSSIDRSMVSFVHGFFCFLFFFTFSFLGFLIIQMTDK